MISPVDQLAQDLWDCFPQAKIDVRKADDPKGFQFLNFILEEFEVAVEWSSVSGFGISSYDLEASAIDGVFEAPQEWYATEQAAFHRIASLVFDQRSLAPRSTRIADLRYERGISQEQLSEQLQVKQATYSKLERREDVKVSSLRRVIEAMGGKLRIQAIFDDSKEVREITFP